MQMQENTVNNIITILTDLMQKNDIKNQLPLAESSISFNLSREIGSIRKGEMREYEPNNTSFSDQSKCDCSNLSDSATTEMMEKVILF